MVPNHAQHCACGRPRPPTSCCLDNGEWRTRPARTTPPGPATGYAHPQCYARSLKDCSKKISNEHGFSDGALSVLGKSFSASGLLGLAPGETRTVSAAVLASRVLCKRHNEALSDVDTQGIRLTTALHAMGVDFASHEPKDDFVLFHGFDIERWLLKTLCCQLAARKAGLSGLALVWEPEPAWNAILFGQNDPPDAGGLHFGAQSVPFYSSAAVGISPLLFPTQAGEIAVTGMLLELAGFAFALSIGAKLKDIAGRSDDFSEFVRRPRCLVFSDGRATKTFQFSWGASGSTDDVSICYVGAPGVLAGAQTH